MYKANFLIMNSDQMLYQGPRGHRESKEFLMTILNKICSDVSNCFEDNTLQRVLLKAQSDVRAKLFASPKYGFISTYHRIM